MGMRLKERQPECLNFHRIPANSCEVFSHYENLPIPEYLDLSLNIENNNTSTAKRRSSIPINRHEALLGYTESSHLYFL